MRERTEITIIAIRTTFIPERSAELRLVLIRMIKLFDPVVRLFAFVALWTLEAAVDIRADFSLVDTERAALVFFDVVVVGALLFVVGALIVLAWLRLE